MLIFPTGEPAGRGWRNRCYASIHYRRRRPAAREPAGGAAAKDVAEAACETQANNAPKALKECQS